MLRYTGIIENNYLMTTDGEKLVDDITVNDVLLSWTYKKIKIRSIEKHICDLTEEEEFIYRIPKNFFYFNSPNKDTYIFGETLIKPQLCFWKCASMTKLKSNNYRDTVVYYDITVSDYYSETLYMNGLRTESYIEQEKRPIKRETMFSLSSKKNLTDNEKTFLFV